MIPVLAPALPLRPPATGESLYDAINALGLNANLQLCLDAGDFECWPGVGDVWTDRSPNHLRFARGTSTSAEGSDPTFNGTVGKQSSGEYFSFDGGDYLTLLDTLPSALAALGKPNFAATVLAVFSVPATSSNHHFVGNLNVGGSGHGWSFGYVGGSTHIEHNWGNTSNAVSSFGGSGPAGSTGLKIASMASACPTGLSGSYYWVNINGTASGNTNFVANATPSSTDATNLLRIGALGDLGEPSANTSRLYALALWNTKLSATDQTSIWSRLRTRYGL